MYLCSAILYHYPSLEWGRGNMQLPPFHDRAIHFVEIFLFLEIQSKFSLYFRNNFLMTSCHSNQSTNFDTALSKMWNICACANYKYSLQNTIYKFSGLFWGWNLHWEYYLIKIVGKWCHQLDHVIFYKNVFGPTKCVLVFYKINLD